MRLGAPLRPCAHAFRGDMGHLVGPPGWRARTAQGHSPTAPPPAWGLRLLLRQGRDAAGPGLQDRVAHGGHGVSRIRGRKGPSGLFECPFDSKRKAKKLGKPSDEALWLGILS